MGRVKKPKRDGEVSKGYHQWEAISVPWPEREGVGGGLSEPTETGSLGKEGPADRSCTGNQPLQLADQ